MYVVEIGIIIVIILSSIYLQISYKQRATLRDLAYRDTVTKSFNRKGLLHYMGSWAGKGSHAVLYIDLDHFKSINDTWGHEAGDQLLRTATRRLRQTLGNRGLVFRVGGDEFVILIKTKNRVQAQNVAFQILEQMSSPMGIDNRTITLSASIGMSMSRRGKRLGSDVIQEADLAMYQAKQTGRNQVVLSDEI